MPAGQQVAFEPALALVFAEHLQDAAVGRDVFVAGQDLGGRTAVGGLEDGAPAVRQELVGADDAEVARLGVEPEHVADQLALHARGLGVAGARQRHVDRIVAEVGQHEVAQQQAAVGVRVGAHAARALGRERSDLGCKVAVLVEQLFRAVAAHPAFEDAQVFGLGRELGHRHLVGVKRAFDLHTVNLVGAGPSLGRAQHDHRPARPLAKAVLPRIGLDRADLRDDAIERGRHLLVHRFGLVAFDPVRLPAVAAHQHVELVVRYAGEHRRPGDLVAVQVQDRQHRAVACGVEELVGVPARRQRPGLGLAVADDAGDQQVGVVEGGAERVRQAVAELAALVDRAGRLGRHMARDAAGKRELLEEPLHPGLVLRDVRVDLAVRALEPGVGNQRRPPMPGAGDIDHVEVVLLDDAVQVHVDEVQPRRRAPVAEQSRLDVLKRQRFLEQRVGIEIDLADRTDR